jgi:hypothetical protein
MPRFYCQVDAGHMIPDRDGFVLPDIKAAVQNLSAADEEDC